ncbi:YbaK/EbsC family protein, partial [Candidatus Microgenomates bacterium]|nr:YbaK/EbsC family protein [Candidatus Microgenomates bacterium]
VGEQIAKADADFCLDHTGFTIGGIPPFGHSERIETLIDKDLRKFKFIWAAAGTIRSVFKIKFTDLVKMSECKITKIK